MVFFNGLGALWAIVGIALAIGLQKIGLIPNGSGLFFLPIFISLFFFDIAYRYLVQRKKYLADAPPKSLSKIDVSTHWLIGNRMGGSLMFMPAWVCSFIVPLWFIFIVKA